MFGHFTTLCMKGLTTFDLFHSLTRVFKKHVSAKIQGNVGSSGLSHLSRMFANLSYINLFSNDVVFHSQTSFMDLNLNIYENYFPVQVHRWCSPCISLLYFTRHFLCKAGLKFDHQTLEFITKLQF